MTKRTPYDRIAMLPAGAGYNEDEKLNSSTSPLCELAVLGKQVIGRAGFNTYNPFELYSKTEYTREARRPPHLVFAELEHETESVLAFITTYGPLDNSGLTTTLSRVEQTVGAKWGSIPKNNVDVVDYWTANLGQCPLMPSLVSDPMNAWHTINIERFYEQQSEFERVFRLSLALRRSPEERGEAVKRVIARFFPEDWEIRTGVASRTWTQKGYMKAAVKYVRDKSNDHLQRIQPVISNTFKVDPFENKPATGISATFRVETLIDALYFMLFHDLAYSAPVRICENDRCNRPFVDETPTVRFCSDRCSTQCRLRKAYAKNKPEILSRRRAKRSGQIASSK